MQELKQINKVSVTIANSELFVNNLNSIKDLVNEAIISFNNNTMQIKAMDPANVSLLVYDVEISQMEYNLTDNTIISVNVGDLYKCLKDFKKANISLLVEDLEHLKVIVKNGVELVFNLKLLNLEDTKEQQIPNLTFVSTAIISYKDFAKVLKSCDKVSEQLILITKDGNTTDLNICAKGEFSKLEVDLYGSIKGFAKSRYSIPYLNKFVKSKTENIKLSWCNDYPLKYDLQNGLYFILAPRVENE